MHFEIFLTICVCLQARNVSSTSVEIKYFGNIICYLYLIIMYNIINTNHRTFSFEETSMTIEFNH